MKDDMLAFLAAHDLCVIATVGEQARPEAALVGFSHSSNLELVIGTSRKSRKFANITQNPQVAIVVGDETGEVQYEGTAQEVTKEEYQSLVEQQHISKLPGSAKFREDPNEVNLKITPTWIRFIKHGEDDTDGTMEEFTDFGELAS